MIAAADDTRCMSDFASLTSQLLIAMPSLQDPHFENTVTLICEHSAEGAMGITINRPLKLKMREIFAQMSDETGPAGADNPYRDDAVLAGGPVSPERGFVLHRDAGDWEATLAIGEGIYVTMSRDILAAMAGNRGPSPAVMALGYAGWEANQLEEEIFANAWLTVPASPELVFEGAVETRWQRAAASIGIDIDQISPGAGHA